jgi:hypothetical protein
MVKGCPYAGQSVGNLLAEDRCFLVPDECSAAWGAVSPEIGNPKLLGLMPPTRSSSDYSCNWLPLIPYRVLYRKVAAVLLAWFHRILLV